jgi:hypothetical protein
MKYLLVASFFLLPALLTTCALAHADQPVTTCQMPNTCAL